MSREKKFVEKSMSEKEVIFGCKTVRIERLFYEFRIL